MKINIESEGTGFGTKVRDSAGNEMKGLTRIDLVIEANQDNRAKVWFCLPSVHCEAKATVTAEHLAELAAAHGYDLVARVN